MKKAFAIRVMMAVLLSFAASGSYAQKKLTIDYYGIVSTEIDSNMSKMTSDLYYTQLCEIQSLTVSDKRSGGVLSKEPDSFTDENLSFYALISKKSDAANAKWIATLTLVDARANTTSKESKEYDSFYKILMEPKSILQESIKNLLEKSAPQNASLSDSKTQQQGGATLSTEFLSGTWEGESSIDKIVIMRGGRGFVVFKNGATMNITLELQGKNLVITQKGRSNASFFPEIPREAALKAAVEADPVKWEFNTVQNDILSGTKYTLTESNGFVLQGSLSVTWKRKD